MSKMNYTNYTNAGHRCSAENRWHHIALVGCIRTSIQHRIFLKLGDTERETNKTVIMFLPVV